MQEKLAKKILYLLREISEKQSYNPHDLIDDQLLFFH